MKIKKSLIKIQKNIIQELEDGVLLLWDVMVNNHVILVKDHQFLLILPMAGCFIMINYTFSIMELKAW